MQNFDMVCQKKYDLKLCLLGFEMIDLFGLLQWLLVVGLLCLSLLCKDKPILPHGKTFQNIFSELNIYDSNYFYKKLIFVRIFSLVSTMNTTSKKL
jgi:hypothetical protein